MKKILYGLIMCLVQTTFSCAEIKENSEVLVSKKTADATDSAKQNQGLKPKNTKSSNANNRKVRATLDEVDEFDEIDSEYEASSENDVTEVIKKEKRKWAYVKAELGKNLDGFATFWNKFGSVQQKYAIVPAIGVCALAPIIGIALGVAVENERQRLPLIAIIVMGFACTSTAATYGFHKLLGRWLEGKAGRCQQALARFAKNWAKHKEKTPTALHGLFEALKADCKKGEGFNKITAEQAQAIVEGLLTIGIVADSSLSF